jgi:K+-transporting ATPase ATPase C chain
MLGVMIAALRASLVTFVLCGLLYPLALTGLAQLILPFPANGSLEQAQDGAIIGSRLIGQQWSGPQWFHGRPSATTVADPDDPSKTLPAPYNAANSSGSNLGPTSKHLMERLMRARRVLEAAQPELTGKALPADMLTASASGLDPDISPDNAALQVARVASARGVPTAAIDALLARQVADRSLGIFGEPRVNVLALNLALERALPGTVTRTGLREPIAGDPREVAPRHVAK